MPFIFILVLSVYLGGNIYVFVKGMHAFSSLPLPAAILLGSLYWLAFLAFVGVFLFRDLQQPPWVGQLLQYVGTGWLVFILYMVIQLLLQDVVRLFGWTVPYGFQIALGVTTLLLFYGFYHYRHPDRKVVNIVINKSSTGYQPLKVVGISDVHLGYATNKQQLGKYVEMIMKEQPDLIVIAGDLIDNSVAPVRFQRMDEELSRLSAPLGIYMVPGNHEYISGINEVEDFLRTTPISFLKDSVVMLPGNVQIIGRDDKANPDRSSLQSLMSRVDPDNPVILLDHQPYNLEESVEAGVDLQFSGHTHRGQIWPMNWLTDRIFEVSYGYKQKGNSQFYVSSGLSLWGPPFRIGTQSEMVVFEISFKE
ncbi:MAG: metallophosphoesterase [Tannerellaceae bacterium]|nr:metallophosphoesterase [Tannerellaceae bacterium]